MERIKEIFHNLFNASTSDSKKLIKKLVIFLLIITIFLTISLVLLEVLFSGLTTIFIKHQSVIIGVLLFGYLFKRIFFSDKKDKLVLEEDSRDIMIVAKRNYPIIRENVFYSLKSCYKAIHTIEPNYISEVECEENICILENGDVIYRFKCLKNDDAPFLDKGLLNVKRTLNQRIFQRLRSKEFDIYPSFINFNGQLIQACMIEKVSETQESIVLEAVIITVDYLERRKQKNSREIPMNIDLTPKDKEF